jgi:MAF protein
LFPFEIVDSGVEEYLSSGYSPAAAASVLASRKAAAVAETISQGIVLAADTVIGFRGEILGKPENDAHAVKMLRMLRGHTHEVITGMAVLNRSEGVKIVSVVFTEVRMRKYHDQEIKEYVETGEPFDKAGSYAIQGGGGRLIESTRGCYNNVIGLPLCETVKLLRSVGVTLAVERGICQLPSGDSCPRVR